MKTLDVKSIFSIGFRHNSLGFCRFALDTSSKTNECPLKTQKRSNFNRKVISFPTPIFQGLYETSSVYVFFSSHHWYFHCLTTPPLAERTLAESEIMWLKWCTTWKPPWVRSMIRTAGWAFVTRRAGILLPGGVDPRNQSYYFLDWMEGMMKQLHWFEKFICN